MHTAKPGGWRLIGDVVAVRRNCRLQYSGGLIKIMEQVYLVFLTCTATKFQLRFYDSPELVSFVEFLRNDGR